MRPVFLLLLIVFAIGQNRAAAQAIDPHLLYEQKCSRCHAPHAGDFVHDSLLLSGDKLLGQKSGEEVPVFLNTGHGNLTPEEIDAMVAFLTQIRKSGQLFHEKCLICHDRAAQFARITLEIEDGRLVGRYSGRDIKQFLKTHGRLETGEVSKIMTVLKRQLEIARK